MNFLKRLAYAVEDVAQKLDDWSNELHNEAGKWHYKTRKIRKFFRKIDKKLFCEPITCDKCKYCKVVRTPLFDGWERKEYFCGTLKINNYPKTCYMHKRKRYIKYFSREGD